MLGASMRGSLASSQSRIARSFRSCSAMDGKYGLSSPIPCVRTSRAHLHFRSATAGTATRGLAGAFAVVLVLVLVAVLVGLELGLEKAASKWKGLSGGDSGRMCLLKKKVLLPPSDMAESLRLSWSEEEKAMGERAKLWIGLVCDVWV